jgi:hypothetical protein
VRQSVALQKTQHRDQTVHGLAHRVGCAAVRLLPYPRNRHAAVMPDSTAPSRGPAGRRTAGLFRSLKALVSGPRWKSE